MAFRRPLKFVVNKNSSQAGGNSTFTLMSNDDISLIRQQAIYELAKDLHVYWGLGKINVNNKIIIEKDFNLSLSRITLVFAVSLIIKKGMDILKINCPENM